MSSLDKVKVLLWDPRMRIEEPRVELVLRQDHDPRLEVTISRDGLFAVIEDYGKRERAAGGLEVLNNLSVAGCGPLHRHDSFPACVHFDGERECAIGRRERLEREARGERSSSRV